MDWFHELPAAPLALVILLLVLAASIGGLALAAGAVRRTRVHAQLDNAAIAGLLAALVGIYAIAAGLTAVAVWSNTVDAATHVGREATAISVLYHDLGAYPQPLQGEARDRLIQYVHRVIDDEWPNHLRGRSVYGGSDVLAELQHAVYALEPASEREKVILAQTLRSFDQLIEMRRGRIQSAEETALPGPLWVVVTLLGAIAIAGCFLLRIESFRMHAIVTALVATPIALVVFFIAVTDRPFRGGVTVSPEPYQKVLSQVIAPDVARGATRAQPPR
jgi:hypothetical protein